MLSFTLFALLAIAAVHARRGYSDDDDDHSYPPCKRGGHGNKGQICCDADGVERLVIEVESSFAAAGELQNPSITRREKAVIFQRSISDTGAPPNVIDFYQDLPYNATEVIVGAQPRLVFARKDKVTHVTLENFDFLTRQGATGAFLLSYTKTEAVKFAPYDIRSDTYQPQNGATAINWNTFKFQPVSIATCCRDDPQNLRVHMSIFPTDGFLGDGFPGGVNLQITTTTIDYTDERPQPLLDRDVPLPPAPPSPPAAQTIQSARAASGNRQRFEEAMRSMTLKF